VGWLEAGQCATQQVPVNANVPTEGAWYLGAIADPRNFTVELLEDNNAKAGTRMGVGYKPDFVVTAVSGPASAQMGGSFTASVTVCNQGTYAGSAEVELFLSNDATITAYSPGQPYNADNFIGGMPMGWLEAGQCATQQVPVNAYAPTSGTWYLGAITDPRNYMQELLEDNNSLAGSTLDVLY
jgi:subtilase family serine protease